MFNFDANTPAGLHVDASHSNFTDVGRDVINNNTYVIGHVEDGRSDDPNIVSRRLFYRTMALLFLSHLILFGMLVYVIVKLG